MKLKYLIAASLLALASAGAQAATTLTLGSTTYGLADSPILISRSTNFTDNWTLNVDPGFGADGAAFNLSGNNLTLTVTNPSSGLAIYGSGNNWFFTAPYSTSLGSYSFTVAGTLANGTSGGNYLIGFAQVAPVPIPPAALLFGSALIGLASLKRKKAAKELIEA